MTDLTPFQQYVNGLPEPSYGVDQAIAEWRAKNLQPRRTHPIAYVTPTPATMPDYSGWGKPRRVRRMNDDNGDDPFGLFTRHNDRDTIILAFIVLACWCMFFGGFDWVMGLIGGGV
jgi:hypothetical protein